MRRERVGGTRVREGGRTEWADFEAIERTLAFSPREMRAHGLSYMETLHLIPFWGEQTWRYNGMANCVGKEGN